jgi:hypothetical protein
MQVARSRTAQRVTPTDDQCGSVVERKEGSSSQAFSNLNYEELGILVTAETTRGW